MYIGFLICIGFFLFGLLTSLGYELRALAVQRHPATGRVTIYPTLPWGTARAVRASTASLVSIVAFFYTISSI